MGTGPARGRRSNPGRHFRPVIEAVSPPPAPRASPTRPGRHFRPDIEGLRAVAILGVVLYHARSSLLSGGYVGVDVFFVVSGFLITDLLWRELAKQGRLSFSGFYARRARRLLPASILVLVATMVASAYLLPPLQLPGVVKDGVASALYVANYRFALTQTNYLNAGAAPSPFLHYWSLGVEEQFYAVWPLLLVGAAIAFRRRQGWLHRARRSPSRRRAAGALLAAGAASFALSVWLTQLDEPWAFYSLPTRAWELAAGGLVALWAPELGRTSPAARSAAAWGGLAAVVASMLWISATTPFPGWAALVPVLGTAAVVAGGLGPGRTAGGQPVTPSARQGPVALLGRQPMRMIGKVSYSWYLWHWPFLVLAPYALGHPLSLWQSLAVALLSGVVATATYFAVENPARTSRFLSALPRRSLLAGGSLSAAGAACCLLVSAALPSIKGHGIAPSARLAGGPGAPAATPAQGKAPATTLEPATARLESLTAQVQAALAQSAGMTEVPANLEPSLQDAKYNEAAPFVDGCMDSFLASEVETCAFGDLTSSTSVVLFGDSHATMWFPALDYAADHQGWKLYVFTKATCPPVKAEFFSPDLGRIFTECTDWQANVLARIAALHPTLVVFGFDRHYSSLYDVASYSPQWLSGLEQMIRAVRQLGPEVLVIGPVGKPPVNIPQCLSTHLSTATACDTPVSIAFDQAGDDAERAVATRAGASWLSVRDWFCTQTTCPAFVDNLLVFRDDNHITEAYGEYLGPVMAAALAVKEPELLSGPGAPPAGSTRGS